MGAHDILIISRSAEDKTEPRLQKQIERDYNYYEHRKPDSYTRIFRRKQNALSSLIYSFTFLVRGMLGVFPIMRRFIEYEASITRMPASIACILSFVCSTPVMRPASAPPTNAPISASSGCPIFGAYYGRYCHTRYN